MTGKTLAVISLFAVLLAAGLLIASADAQYKEAQDPKTVEQAVKSCGSCHKDQFDSFMKVDYRPARNVSQSTNPASKEITPTPHQIVGKTYNPLPSIQGFEEEGVASWYGPDFHGRQTSCGEIYDMHGLTAAHKTLPMNTWLLIRNLENDRVVTVRVNDRGPFYEERIVDLTRAAADSLGFLDRGTARVRITVLAGAENLAAIPRV